MAQIVLNIPDEHLGRVVNAVSESFGYEEFDIDGQPNPETRAQYSRRKLATWLKRRVLDYEQRQAREVAGNDITEVDITA